MSDSREECHLCHLHDHNSPSQLLRTTPIRDSSPPRPRRQSCSRSNSIDQQYPRRERDHSDHRHHHHHSSHYHLDHHHGDRHRSSGNRFPSALARLSDHATHSLPASRSNTLKLYPEQVSVLPDGGHRYLGGDRASIRSLELSSPINRDHLSRSHVSLHQCATLQKPSGIHANTDLQTNSLPPLRSHGSHLSLNRATLGNSHDRTQDYFLQLNRLPFQDDKRKQRFNLQTVMLIGCYTLLFVMAIIIGLVLSHQNGWLGFGSPATLETGNNPNKGFVSNTALGSIRDDMDKTNMHHNEDSVSNPNTRFRRLKDGTNNLVPVHNVVQVRNPDSPQVNVAGVFSSSDPRVESRPRSISSGTGKNIPGNRPVQTIQHPHSADVLTSSVSSRQAGVSEHNIDHFSQATASIRNVLRQGPTTNTNNVLTQMTAGNIPQNIVNPGTNNLNIVSDSSAIQSRKPSPTLVFDTSLTASVPSLIPQTSGNVQESQPHSNLPHNAGFIINSPSSRNSEFNVFSSPLHPNFHPSQHVPIENISIRNLQSSVIAPVNFDASQNDAPNDDSSIMTALAGLGHSNAHIRNLTAPSNAVFVSNNFRSNSVNFNPIPEVPAVSSPGNLNFPVTDLASSTAPQIPQQSPPIHSQAVIQPNNVVQSAVNTNTPQDTFFKSNHHISLATPQVAPNNVKPSIDPVNIHQANFMPQRILVEDVKHQNLPVSQEKPILNPQINQAEGTNFEKIQNTQINEINMEKMKMLKEILDAEGSGQLLQDLITLKNNRNSLQAISQHLTDVTTKHGPNPSIHETSPIRNIIGVPTAAVLQHQVRDTINNSAVSFVNGGRGQLRPDNIPKSNSGISSTGDVNVVTTTKPIIRVLSSESKSSKAKNNIQVVRELLASLINSPEVQEILSSRNRQASRQSKAIGQENISTSGRNLNNDDMRNLLLRALAKELPNSQSLQALSLQNPQPSIKSQEIFENQENIERGQKALGPRGKITRAQQLFHFNSTIPSNGSLRSIFPPTLSFSSRIGVPESKKQSASSEPRGIRPATGSTQTAGTTSRGRRRPSPDFRLRVKNAGDASKQTSPVKDNVAKVAESVDMRTNKDELRGEVVRHWRHMDNDGTVSEGTVRRDGSFAFTNCRPVKMCQAITNT